MLTLLTTTQDWDGRRTGARNEKKTTNKTFTESEVLKWGAKIIGGH